MFEYTDITVEDLPYLVYLYETYLDSGEYIREVLEEGFRAPGYMGVKCMDGDKVVGVFTARPGIIFTGEHEELIAKISEEWGEYDLFTGDILVVLPEYRNQGIARQLSVELRERLKALGCDRLIAEAWRRSEDADIPASGIMKYLGKETVIGVYDDFYRDFRGHGITCPDCGDEDCSCGAVIYIIDIT